jgi:hypothetical protein
MCLYLLNEIGLHLNVDKKDTACISQALQGDVFGQLYVYTKWVDSASCIYGFGNWSSFFPNYGNTLKS